jgi:hypothetical protein
VPSATSSPRLPTNRITEPSASIAAVGPRQPCPCGSGKRYKACHGKRQRGVDQRFVTRPFEGLPSEADWIALREIVSAASAPIRLARPHAGRPALVVTLLPMAAPALVRPDGEILLALQTTAATDDPSADLAGALLAALESAPGTTVAAGVPGSHPSRLQDLLDPASEFRVTVHETFDFWLDGTEAAAAEVRASLEQANAGVLPATRLTSVEACYWCRIGDRDQLRWVMPYDEEQLLDALARLHARRQDGVGPGTRLLGTFRALGRLVPVWDLVPGTASTEVEKPASALASRLTSALEITDPLSADERRARAGLANRQVTIR